MIIAVFAHRYRRQLHINWFVNIIGVHLHFHASSWNDLPKLHVCKSKGIHFLPISKPGVIWLLNTYVRLFVLSKEGRLQLLSWRVCPALYRQRGKGKLFLTGKEYKVLKA